MTHPQKAHSPETFFAQQKQDVPSPQHCLKGRAGGANGGGARLPAAAMVSSW